MALPVQTQTKIWGIVAVVFFAVLWALGNVLLPFLIGSAIAYLLDPLADRLEARGLSRTAATAVISVGFALVAAAGLLIIIPAMIRQLIDLIQLAPELTAQARTFIETRFPSIGEQISQLHGTLPGIGETVRERGVEVLTSVLSGAMSFVNVVVVIFVVPVVTVYMLLDWDRMVAQIDALLPRDHAPTLRRLAGEMDRTMAGFIRGQGLVCLIQGSFYAVALMLVGLNFGLLVGVFAGLISFIPFVGSLVGGALSIGLALFQFWDQPLMILLVAGIFAFGQVVEGNFLTPKLVGGSVGLHPVWLLLALSIFGTLFGFTGMLVAVPISAMIGVLVRFAVEQYRCGRLYLGVEARDGAKAPADRDDPAAE